MTLNDSGNENTSGMNECRQNMPSVVETDFGLAFEPLAVADRRLGAGRQLVQCGFLMRILAVPQGRFLRQRDREAIREVDAGLAVEVAGDRGIVGRRPAERRPGQIAARRIDHTQLVPGKGVLAVTRDRCFQHPLSLGMMGMHGEAWVNNCIQEADLLLAFGMRFDDRVTGKIEHFCPHAKIIHIDVDPSSISKTVRVDVPIVGPVQSVLRDLLTVLRAHKPAGEHLGLAD